MTRTHAICAACYRRSPLQRESLPFPLPQCYIHESCCYCSQMTFDSIYVRDVLPPTKHCRCTEFTEHPKAGSAASKTDAHYENGRLRSGMVTHTHGSYGTYINGLRPLKEQLRDDEA